MGEPRSNVTPDAISNNFKPRAVLNGKKKKRKEKKSVPEPVFPKKPAGTPCAQPCWQLADGSWQLAVGGVWWWLAAVGGWWRLAVVGSWRLVAAGGWRRLVAGGWWRLAVDGSWRLAVGGPLGRSLRAVLSKKKKSGPLRTALFKPQKSLSHGCALEAYMFVFCFGFDFMLEKAGDRFGVRPSPLPQEELQRADATHCSVKCSEAAQAYRSCTSAQL